MATKLVHFEIAGAGKAKDSIHYFACKSMIWYRLKTVEAVEAIILDWSFVCPQ